MNNRRDHITFGATEVFTKSIMEETKGIFQRDVKGVKNECLFLGVGFPQIIRHKLRCILVQK